MAWTILRGGRVLDIAAGTADFADILIEGDTIREIGPPGLAAPSDAAEISARRRLLHPGLVNAHTHGHGNLGKGMGDRWTLELLLTAAPWITGNRTLDDRYLSTQLGAVEMVMKGCTACYDLSFEWPLPTADGLALAAQAYANVGMRAVVAPMVADRSFFEAIPGLMEALPGGLAGARRRIAPAAGRGDDRRDARRARRLGLRPRLGASGGGPHHSTPLLGCVHSRLRRSRAGV
jgi:5-methylthioadenosine/S-adenosylhomocysteine deaminase